MPQKQNSENFEIAKKESLKGDYSIYKPDPILLVRDNMNLTQMRFFEAYLSKIDASNPETYKVRIYLDTVAKLANIDLSNRKAVNKMCEDIENSRFDFKRYIERYEPEAIDPNIKKIHRYTFALFDTFRLSETIDGEYFIEVTPGVKMSEMLQKYQRNYATYELQKVYALSTKTNMRMYGCFKRFQKFGTTKISIELFKEYLGIDENKYERTTDLRKFVLEPGIKEINQKTDIFVTYKPYKKRRLIAGWSFTIKAKTPIGDNALDVQPAVDKVAIKSESTDLTNQKRFIAAGEYINDFSINPLELNFEDETDKSNYVNKYAELNIKDEFCRDFLLEAVPEEVHQYSEINLGAILSAAQLHIKLSEVFEMHHNERRFDWDTRILKAVEAYTKQRWLPKDRYNVKKDIHSFYVSCLTSWLEKNKEQFN